ncbi:MAG: hypothetical protein U0791_20805 [Gemmataceae bacterium]
MTATERAQAYLHISHGGILGGLAWSASGDAIERWNGTTLAFAEEIRDVLAGAFSRPPVPPFPFVLDLLRTMLDDPGSESPNGHRLRLAFAEHKRTSQLLRNAGILISELCRSLPPAANVPAADDIALTLGRLPSSSAWIFAEVPPLPQDEFTRRIEEILVRYDDARLGHWFKFGCDPLGDAEKLAEPLETLPARVEKLLAMARREPRLMGAASLVPALDGALTLPARRRSPDALPQGGYCDVTTRGEPDRLLPGQFALDPDEFIRRFAERELLYFQREEPHATRRPERMIVLDQGVRTWGGVRLALASAALVFMRKEAKRVGRVRFATTGAPDPVDVQVADVESLAKSLASSDLSAAPAACLTIARTRGDADDPRDVILLTHPRTLQDAGIQTLLSDTAAADRVFALAVAECGEAELVQWKEGGPEVIRRFRIDLTAAEAVSVLVNNAPAGPFESGEWAGDVEPVAFPFRPGLVTTIERMGFDADGEWLVTAGRNGNLQAVGANGGAPEVLPRAFRGGGVLRTVEALLGVRGGVVVCGRMQGYTPITVSTHYHGQPVGTSSASEYSSLERHVAAHYDRKSRRVKLHDLGGPCDTIGAWAAHPELNCVSLSLPDGRGAAVDLASSEVRTGPGEQSGSLRVDTARWAARRGHRSSPHELRILENQVPDEPLRVPTLRAVANGMIVYQNGGGSEYRLALMQDGKYLLAGGNIVKAKAAEGTLALVQKRGESRFLLTVDVPSHRICGETQVDATRDQFALSADGRFIAYTRARFRTLTIAPVGELSVPRAEARAAGLHDKLQLAFDENDSLHVGIGSFAHRFRIEHGSLRHSVQQGTVPSAIQADCNLPTKYDWSRFPPNESATGRDLIAVTDRLGQVLVFRKSGILAASFLVRRDRAAAWCPGGVFWGEPSLIGGPPTPHAAEAIANSLTKREAT